MLKNLINKRNRKLNTTYNIVEELTLLNEKLHDRFRDSNSKFFRHRAF
jgi:hypothetical protein